MVNLASMWRGKERTAVSERGMALIKGPCGWIIKPKPHVVFSKPNRIVYLRSAEEVRHMKDQRKKRDEQKTRAAIEAQNRRRVERFKVLSHAAKEVHREKRRLAYKARIAAKQKKIRSFFSENSALAAKNLAKMTPAEQRKLHIGKGANRKGAKGTKGTADVPRGKGKGALFQPPPKRAKKAIK